MSKSDSDPVSDESNMLSAALEVDGDVLEAAEVVDALGVPSYMCLHLCLKKKEYVNILGSLSFEGSFFLMQKNVFISILILWTTESAFCRWGPLSPPQTYLSFAYQKNVQDRTFTIQFLFHRFMEALP